MRHLLLAGTLTSRCVLPYQARRAASRATNATRRRNGTNNANWPLLWLPSRSRPATVIVPLGTPASRVFACQRRLVLPKQAMAARSTPCCKTHLLAVRRTIPKPDAEYADQSPVPVPQAVCHAVARPHSSSASEFCGATCNVVKHYPIIIEVIVKGEAPSRRDPALG